MIRQLKTEAKTYRPFDPKTAKGIYLSVAPTAKAIEIIQEISISLGYSLSLAEIEDLHCTVVYSKTVPQVKEVPDPGLVYEVRLVGVEWWPGADNEGYLVLRLQSPALVEFNKQWMAKGCTSSHSTYNPHMTLKKDIGAMPLSFISARKGIYPYVGTTFDMYNAMVENLK